VRLLDSFGEYIIAIDEGNTLTVWELGLHYTVSEFSLPEDFTPCCIIHPPTYADKVVIGSKEGLSLS
jgi:U3 small nucleolar RNA-associated protein 21